MENEELQPDKNTGKKPKVKKYAGLLGDIHDNPTKTIQRLVAVSENAMLPRLAVWERHRRKYRRGLSYLRAIETDTPLYFVNYIFQIVEAVKANLTRNMPDMSVDAKGKADDLTASIMGKLLKDSLDDADFTQVRKKVVHNGLLNTLGWFKVWYNPDNDESEYGNVIESVQTDDMLIDPKASTVDNARWVIQRIPDVSADYVYAEYGEMPGGSSNDTNVSSISMSKEPRAYVEGALSTEAKEATPVYDLYECWIQVYDKDAPNKWYIVTVCGNKVLRSEFSVYKHNKTPFVHWFDVEDDTAENFYFRGIGEIEEIEPLQDRSDMLNYRIYKNISLQSNRQRYVSAQSGLNPDSMDNTTGRIYRVNGEPSKAVYYDTPPTLSNDVYIYNESTENLIQSISGVFDVAQGKRPTGITAGRAITELKDSAETRLMERADSLAISSKRVGYLLLNNILQFYDAEKIFKATDLNVDTDVKVIAEYPDELQITKDPTTGEDIPQEEMDTMKAQFKQENGIALVLSDIDFRWDVKVSGDSALPSTKAERGQMASEIFRIGGIDRKALLDSLDYPNKEEILKRLEGSITGKNAGDGSAETGMESQKVIESIGQALVQMGLDPQTVQQVLQQAVQGGGQQSQPQSQPGGYQPQITQ